MTIHDGFTDLKINRQRRWQLRNRDKVRAIQARAQKTYANWFLEKLMNRKDLELTRKMCNQTMDGKHVWARRSWFHIKIKGREITLGLRGFRCDGCGILNSTIPK